MPILIDRYIASLCLPTDERCREAEEELRAHLEDAVRELQMAGLPLQESQEEAIRRFGSPDEVTAAFTQQRRAGGARSLVGACLIAAALALIGGGVVGASAHSSQHPTDSRRPTPIVTNHLSPLPTVKGPLR